MSEQANIEAAKRAHAAFGQGDMDGVLAVFAPDVELTWHGPAEIPFAGTWHGHEGVAAWVALLGEHLDFSRFNPEEYEFVAQGDRVVVLGGDGGIVKSTGRPWDHEWVQVITFKDGKASAFKQYSQDTHAMFIAFTPQ